MTLGSNCSSGSTLIAVVVSGSAAAVTSVKDGAGNTFIPLVTTGGFSGGGIMAVHALNTPAGDVGTAPVITVTFGAAGDDVILVQEVSGLASGATLAALVDGTPGAVTATASPLSPATTTSGGAGEYLLGAYGDNGNSATWTKPAALTADTHGVNASSLADLGVAYGSTAGGSEAGSWTVTGTVAGGAVLLAFKLAAGGAAAATPQPLVVPQAAVMQAANW